MTLLFVRILNERKTEKHRTNETNDILEAFRGKRILILYNLIILKLLFLFKVIFH